LFVAGDYGVGRSGVGGGGSSNSAGGSAGGSVQLLFYFVVICFVCQVIFLVN